MKPITRKIIYKSARFKLGIIVLFTIPLFLLFACTPGERGKPLKLSNSTSIDSSSELSPAQETAFDALITLQVEIRGNHIYSTFPNIHHDGFPADTSFVISRTELLYGLEELLGKYNTDIANERLNRLANEAVLSQQEYLVKQCYGSSFQMSDGVLKEITTSTRRSGTWVLPGVLGRRDVILVW